MWIRKILYKLRTRLKYRACYKEADKLNMRIYTNRGICAGHAVLNTNRIYFICLDCPYFRDIRDNDDWS